MLTPEMAKKILDVQPSAENVARMAALRERSDAGTLTADERDEYRQLVEADGYLSFIKAQARGYLAAQSNGRGENKP